MKITRKIDTTDATYSLDQLNQEQFRFLLRATEHYLRYTHHCIPDAISPLGELMDKLNKMEESSTTVIN